ncbi:hypothetical protein FG91_02418 [Sphingopyxis sp. LC81]|uniref:hypothetical protein n=1 Tax=Sphingopyxis sp. LC81 TaxID=1502850 RepID=UPI00050E33CB|nr:hypothetical protein [Sphingopyxis sp. LC81]KGB54168.1 hypothetical protein FG91_02418 [Sphingopyxis sp. LC81]
MNSRQKFGLALLPIAVAIYMVGWMGWAANDVVFYGVIGLLLAVKIAMIVFKLRHESSHD